MWSCDSAAAGDRRREDKEEREDEICRDFQRRRETTISP